MAEPAGRLRIDQLSKRYGTHTVLDTLDLTVEDGEFMTILGPSGSGKTTVLRLIGGFTQPSGGRILFGDADVTQMPIYRRPFNTVFQDYALFPHMTVGQNVAYGLMVRGVPKSEITARVDESLTVVSLEDYGDRYPTQLSGGQRQRVALARALICHPRLILLDEPLAALDAELRRQMRAFLKSLQRQTGITFVFVTHDQEEAISMSDRICVINAGKVRQIGAPQDIYYRPATAFVATFFGDNNLLGGRLHRNGSDMARVDTACGPVFVRAPQLADMNGASAVTVAVRPEALRIVSGVHNRPKDENRLAGQVASVEFVGPTSHVRISPEAEPSKSLLLKVPSLAGDDAVKPGDNVIVAWRPQDCAILPETTIQQHDGNL